MSNLLLNLNELSGGLFIIAAFGIVAARQIRGCMIFFIFQSTFLAASAFLLGLGTASKHLMIVGGINILTKVIFLPWLLTYFVHRKIYTKREISQVLSIPTSLIIALLLTIAAYFISLPWIAAAAGSQAMLINVPLGLAGLFLGAYTLSVRREAVPQLLGLLSMENGAFFAGVAIAPNLPLLLELALAFDILMVTFIVGILTRTVHQRVGTTAVGTLSSLREDSRT